MGRIQNAVLSALGTGAISRFGKQTLDYQKGQRAAQELAQRQEEQKAQNIIATHQQKLKQGNLTTAGVDAQKFEQALDAYKKELGDEEISDIELADLLTGQREDFVATWTEIARQNATDAVQSKTDVKERVNKMREKIKGGK